MNKQPPAQPICGVGTDIIEIQRIKEAIKRHGQRFLDRIFTRNEQTYCLGYKDSTPRFAGRFAAKEAVVKALGRELEPEIKWTEIEVINDLKGKPEVYLSDRLQKALSPNKVFLSISHCNSFATATAIVAG